MFDKSQSAFEDLRKIIAEGTSPVYLWVGAGMSQQAGFPSWAELKGRLIDKARNFIRQQVHDEELDHKEALLRVAETDNDAWNSFDRIYEAIGESEYCSCLLSEFESATSCDIPISYKKLLGIAGVNGVITTNIDKLVTRTLAEEFGISPTEFCGYECSDYVYTLGGGKKFVLNLHGIYEKRSSWIMRRSDLEKLKKDKGYQVFLASVFTGKVVVFAGVNPLDEAVLVHLEGVRDKDAISGSLPIFWITERKDRAAAEFCDKYNVRRIVYSSANNHRELNDVVALLNSGKSFDDEQLPPRFINVAKSERSVRNFDEIEFNKLSAAELRDVLNKKAVKILAGRTAKAYEEYGRFLESYKRLVHNAWFVDVGEEVLGLTISEKVGDGAFGRVFKAYDAKGAAYAVKVLKEDVLWQPGWLQSFRRGVKAMEILSGKSIAGVVRYESASEIPALVSMEWIDGPDLYEVVQQKRLKTWREKLRVLCEIGKIIKLAHALPERVLHRDLRPQNIMLKGFDEGGDWEVRVLDFDLAYHKGANEVSMQVGYGNGFSAPEQTVMSSGGSRRSSRVDSYGFAMLCYYVITGNMPLPGQCKMQGWDTQIESKVCPIICEEWRSLPYKMAALIKKCTDEDQNRRLDLYMMHDMISDLSRVLLADRSQVPPELLLDELAYRVAIDKRQQKDLNQMPDGSRRLECFDGTLYMFWCEGLEINFEISWHNKGDFEFAAAKKMLGDKTSALVEKLKSFGYLVVEHHFEGQGARVKASFSVKGFDMDRLRLLSQTIAKNGVAPHRY